MENGGAVELGTNIMIIERTKLYQDKWFDIREYELKRGEHEDIVCIYKGKRMTLTPEDQKKKRMLLNKTPYDSKINIVQKYFIFSFLWQPDKELTEEEKLIELSKQCL